MSVSLFRRWRSQKFSDLVGQESVVSTLQNVLAAGDPARAYLFCGPRGTGKTSSARIFAKALNCENGPAAEPCNECTQCQSISNGNNLDVFEIDAASHTQVDKIRDFIVEKVHFTPVSARYKVYIIDEVHKLSTSSFNALLKTLEEPPSHVVFVLATTHPHEMPSTILSRCQRYDFRPLTAGEAEKHLLMIAEQENIQLDVDAARQLARAADGSLRDALVLFEQANVYAEGPVTRDGVLDLLGGVGYEVMEEMFSDLVSGDAASALQRLDSWIVRGRDLKRLAESFQDHLRMMLLLMVRSEDQSIRHLSTEERASLDRIVAKVSVRAVTQWLRAVGDMLGQIRHGRRARLEWEMLLVELACPQTDPTLDGLESRVERLEASGGGSGASVDSDLVHRIEALERAPSQPIDDSRIVELERQLARLSHSLQELSDQETVSTAQSPKSVPEVREAIVPTEGTEVATVANLPVEVEPEGDIVDQWLKMPEILVTGRVTRSGQTHLLDDTSTPPQGIEEPADTEELEPPQESAPTHKLASRVDEPAPSQKVNSPVEEPAPTQKVNSSVDEPAPTQKLTPPMDLPAATQNSSSSVDEPAPTQQPASSMEESVATEKLAPPIKASEPLRSQEEPVTPQKPAPGVEERTFKESTSVESSAQTENVPPADESGAGESVSEEAAKLLSEPKEFFRLLMQNVKEQDIRLHAVLADARLTGLTATQFQLAVPEGYDWHFGKIQEGQQLLESVAQTLMPGCTPQLQCSIGGSKASPPKENEHEELVKRATGVFGGSSILGE